MKVVFFGTPEFVIPVIEALSESFKLIGVVTLPDSPVLKAAQKLKIQSLTPDELTDQSIKEIKALEPDIFVVASFGTILPKRLLEIPKASFNIHPSLLPKYRGASPIQTAILNGDEVSGVTIILMDEEMDHGPILSQKKIRLSQQDNFDTLSIKMFQEGTTLLVDCIKGYFEVEIKPRLQNHAIASYCHPISKQDGYFELDTPPSFEKLDRMIRAYFPWPGVWTRFKGRIVKFYPGGFVQMEGKNKTPLKNFLNGYPDFPLKEFR